MNEFERLKCLELTNRMMHMDLCKPFKDKVDPVRDGAPDYHTIVKQPMDLTTVRRSLMNNEYKNITEWFTAVNLIWSNAMLYNRSGTILCIMAQEMEMWFRRKVENMPRNKDEEWLTLLRKSSKKMLDLSQHPPLAMVSAKPPVVELEQTDHAGANQKRELARRTSEDERGRADDAAIC
jgi:hypothetical protein